MRHLTADDLIHVWELGHQQDHIERAVTVLAAAFPEKGRDELWRLSLGQRNAHLLGLRERLFGSEMNAFSECPKCGQRLEFSLSVSALRDAGLVEASDTEFDLEFDLEAEGYALRFRLLDSRNLKDAAASGDVNAARNLLVKHCMLEARREGEVVTVEELPETVIEQLATHLAECDPQAEMLIDMVCPVCEFRWQIPFDLASFLYTEIGAQARLLLREVHILARAYAWREADILALSARRRQYYLKLLDQ